MIVILPIMYRLAHDPAANVIVGHGTKEACDHAIEIAHVRHKEKPWILGTATVPIDKQFGTEPMGIIALKYIESVDPLIPGPFLQAPSFNTIGEIQALCRFLRSNPATEVLITVKWWHAPRVAMIVRRIIRHPSEKPSKLHEKNFPIKR